MATQLTKIPFILTAAWGVNELVTPPSKASKAELKENGIIVDVTMLGGKMLNISLASLEVLTLISRVFPSMKMSPWIERNLVRNPTGTPSMSALYLFAWVLQFAGGVGRVWCYKEMGRFFTFILAIRDGHRLVKTGPYNIVRHPSYTALLSVVFGVALNHLSTASWLRECSGLSVAALSRTSKFVFVYCGIVTWAIMARTVAEDKMMRKEFGDEWTAWAAKVRYRLIPGVF